MNPFLNYFNPEELLEDLRFCAHRLLLAYNDTLQSALWDASEKAAEACEHLMLLVDESKPAITFH